MPEDKVDAVWPQASAMIELATKTMKNKYKASDVKQDIADGKLRLWVAIKGSDIVAAFTTRIIQYPERRALAIDWIGGKQMRGWLKPSLDTAQKYAREFDCKHIEGYGVRAWGRVLKPHGWEEEYISYRKEL